MGFGKTLNLSLRLGFQNLIPMETLEGRYVPGQHRQLVKSSADANMNMIRA